MASELEFKELFAKWNQLNEFARNSMNNFDFSELKKIRLQQSDLEDKIYEILLNNAPENIKSLLPENCGQMEIGCELSQEKFYFVMEDPENNADEEKIKLIAITIDANKNINIEKNFKIED
ncbi:MAG: hypothetical protein ACTSQP_15405 [Promethearchaeota archaeon]